MLMKAGWDGEHISAVLTEKFKARERIVEATVEMRPPKDDEIVAAFARLKKAGFAPELVDRTAIPGGISLHETWDSYTRQPWWCASTGGRRSIVAFGRNAVNLTRISAGFVRDLWANLGDGPEDRLPVVRRFNLLSWTSTEALTRFETTVGPATDVAVVYGGVLDDDHVHHTLSYLAAMSSAFAGILFYEAAIEEDLKPEVFLGAAKRAGFTLMLGVSNG